jgi:hypothetical protein
MVRTASSTRSSPASDKDINCRVLHSSSVCSARGTAGDMISVRSLAHA